MKREIVDVVRYPSPCCPGHDQFPNDTYRSRRSKKARARDKGVEHRFARRVKNYQLRKDTLRLTTDEE